MSVVWKILTNDEQQNLIITIKITEIIKMINE
jgi:hypothetical protein